MGSNNAAESLRSFPVYLFILLTVSLLPAQEKGIYLTETERAWIRAHPVIKVAPDPDFPPIEFFDERGIYKGLTPEYLDLLGEILGIEFQILPTGSWDQALDMVRERDADMFGAATITRQRFEYVNFTAPYLSYEAVILVNDGDRRSLTLKDLAGEEVLVTSGYYIHDILSDEYPEIRLKPTATVADGLKALSLGEGSAFVGNVSTISYYLEQEGITNLRLAGRTGRFYNLSLAVRNDWPEFLIILNKALDQIPGEKRTEINARWIRLEDTALEKSRTVQKILTVVSLSILLCLILIFLWNRSLKKAIGKKTMELKRYEDEMIQAGKMEIIGKMSSGVAHDFNNVLNGMNSVISLMEMDMAGSRTIGSEELRRYLSMLRLSGNRASEIVKNLLSLSRKQEMSLVPLDLNDVIRNVILICTPNLDSSVRIESHCPEEPAGIRGDEVRLEQVILNLCINAGHAMTIMKQDGEKRGGVIELILERCTGRNPLKRSSGSQEYWRITVRDSGVGIEKDLLENIFTPFFTTKEGKTGTGLGLSMSYNTVREHSGFMEVHSRPGEGSSFEIYLPAIKERESP